MKKVMVVLSGGQDSSTCLFWAMQQKEFGEVHAVTFNYGQRHKRELDAARTVAKIAGVVSHEVVDVGPVLRSRSPLVNQHTNLELYDDYASMDKIIGDRVELTFVPMRNPFFLTLAANIAVSLDCFDLVTGVCQADNANYPDCRQGFINAQENSTRLALGRPFLIHTPLMYLSKARSINLATKIPGAYEALAFTHTAYDGGYPPVGKDHASIVRAHGFEEAGLPDPLVVRAWIEGLMSLPETDNYKDIKILDDVTQQVTLLKQALARGVVA